MVGLKGGMVGRLLQKRVKGVPVLIEQGIMETSSLTGCLCLSLQF